MSDWVGDGSDWLRLLGQQQATGNSGGSGMPFGFTPTASGPSQPTTPQQGQGQTGQLSPDELRKLLGGGTLANPNPDRGGGVGPGVLQNFEFPQWGAQQYEQLPGITSGAPGKPWGLDRSQLPQSTQMQLNMLTPEQRQQYLMAHSYLNRVLPHPDLNADPRGLMNNVPPDSYAYAQHGHQITMPRMPQDYSTSDPVVRGPNNIEGRGGVDLQNYLLRMQGQTQT